MFSMQGRMHLIRIDWQFYPGSEMYRQSFHWLFAHQGLQNGALPLVFLFSSW